jgi:hypothetical protein
MIVALDDSGFWLQLPWAIVTLDGSVFVCIRLAIHLHKHDTHAYKHHIHTYTRRAERLVALRCRDSDMGTAASDHEYDAHGWAWFGSLGNVRLVDSQEQCRLVYFSYDSYIHIEIIHRDTHRSFQHLASVCVCLCACLFSYSLLEYLFSGCQGRNWNTCL